VRTEAEITETARNQPAFSNGTEGEGWMDNWCYRCAVDAPFQRGAEPLGCPLIAVALLGKTPAEWVEQPWTETGPPLADRYHCTEFRPDDGGDADPPPPPVLPGQLDLFTADALDGFEAELSQPRQEALVHGAPAVAGEVAG
jgi:hypothetical protein